MVYCIGGEAQYYQPPDPVLCTWCDGEGVLDVAAVVDCQGVVHDHPKGYLVQVTCPRCDGDGEEPADQ